MFFPTLDGRQLRVDAVVAVTPLGYEAVKLSLADGVECEARFEDWVQALSSHTSRLLPAEPGTYLLNYGLSEGEFWHCRETVIGWAVDRTGNVDPVLFTGAFRRVDNPPIVQFPNGQVHDYCASWDTLESWIEDMQRELAQDPPHSMPARLH